MFWRLENETPFVWWRHRPTVKSVLFLRLILHQSVHLCCRKVRERGEWFYIKLQTHLQSLRERTPLLSAIFAPADAQRARASYIIERIDSVKSAHPDCGVVLLGDFNTLDVTNILTNHTLKQLVREPTRSNSVVDLVISHLASYYNKPVVRAHLGSSDHCSVHWVPNPNYGCSKLTAKKKVVKLRRFPESALNAFGRWVSTHSWFAHTCAVDYLPVDSLTTSFSDDLWNAINIYFPAKSVKIHPTDKPWMSAEIKVIPLKLFYY